MAKTDIGRAVPLLRGEYNPATTYELNDIVSLNGSLYWHYSHEETTNVAPQATSTWKVVLSLADAEAYIARAETAAGEAEDAKDAALAAQTAAETASTTAVGASATATAARNDAVTAKTAAETAQAGAVSAKNDAVTAKEAAQTAASSAGTSATNANNSAGTAQYYAESAGTSASTATTKASEASASASTASTAATTATTKASEASTSATTATTKAGEASTSATSAASSAAAAQAVKDSIPEDYSQLSEDVSDLKTHLSNITGNVAFTTWEDGDIRCDDATVDITNIHTGEYKHQIIGCSAGDVFTISGQSYGNAARLWCFISEDGTNLGAETANATVEEKIITAPNNASKLIINWSYVSYGTPNNVVTVYKNKLIKQAVSELAEEIAEQTEQIELVKTYFEPGVNLFDASNAHDGYIININGAEEIYNGACSSDYIDLKAGLYCYETAPTIYGVNAKYVPTYTEDNTFISNVEGTLDGNIVRFTLSVDSRIRLKLASATYHNVMLIKGSIYPSEYVPYTDDVYLSDSVKVKLANIVPNVNIDNPLYGKKVVFDGDSICHGTSVGQGSPYYGWGYAGRIGNANDMEWYNVAESGATITHGLKFRDNTDRHWISSYIDTIYSNYPDAEYIILEGGTNDADLLNTDAEKTGEVIQTSWSNFDYETYSGALDYLFYNALNKFPNAKIGFIVAQKMGVVSRYDSQFYRRRFFNMAIEACKKWSIPYIDLWDMSGLNPKVPSQFTEGSQTNLYTDGQHLTDLGYDKITPKIESWMKTL